MPSETEEFEFRLRLEQETEDEPGIEQPQKESFLGGLGKAAVRGTFEGAAGTLDLLERVDQFLRVPSRTESIERRPDGRFEVKRREEEPTFFAKEAAKIRKFTEDNLKRGNVSGSIAGAVIEGTAKLPAMILQVELAGGGIGGFSRLGAIQGSKEGIGGAATGAATGAAQGVIFQAASLAPLKVGVTTGAALMAAPAYFSGKPKEDVVAEAVLGGFFVASGKRGAIEQYKKNPNLLDKAIRRVEIGKNRAVSLVRKELRDPRIPVMDQVRQQIDNKNELITGIKNQFRDVEKAQIDVLKKASAEELKGLDKKIVSVEEKISSEKNAVREDIKAETKRMKKDLESFDNRLTSEIDIAAISTQKKMGDFFRRNSESYKVRKEVIADRVDKSGEPITRGEISDLLNTTLEMSAKEAEISSGTVFSMIKSLFQSKYSLEVKDAQGNIVLRNPKEVIPFKEFRRDLKSIYEEVRALKAQGKRFSQDEIPAAILHSQEGQYLATKSPDFAKLQEQYSPVISYMNKLQSIMKPYRGEAYTAQGEALIKKYVSGDAKGSEQRIMKFLENGTKEFGEGIGNISGKARQVAKNLKTLKEKMAQAKENESSRLLQVAEKHAEEISKLTQKKETTQADYDKKIDSVMNSLQVERAREQMKVSMEIKRLEGRKDKVTILQLKRAKLNSLYRGIAFGISALAGGGWLVSRLARGGGQAVNYFD